MNREQYVKPIVMQLHYATDSSVSIATPCKVTGSATGPTPSSCTGGGVEPCITLGS